MDPLGNALRKLRNIGGFSVSRCAELAGIDERSVSNAEQGAGDVSAIDNLARFYAVDPAELREGHIRSVEGLAGATVFLLHGAYQDFYSDDLDLLEHGMLAGRLLATLEGSIDRIARRFEFIPTPPAGPHPADAARQGYKLARQVRRKLMLDNEPLPEMRQLLEEVLGIAVLVGPLTDLRAASILDSARVAAAVLLSEDDHHRLSNPHLARVYLAHELCHLLFDPGNPGSVQISLEDRSPDDRETHAAGSEALLESRAKGFAAELLLPKQGLEKLLGKPEQTALAANARALIERACTHFGTPWEIASNHLRNHDFLDRNAGYRPLTRRPEVAPQSHETKLPAPGEAPLSVGGRLPEQPLSDSTPLYAAAMEQRGQDALDSSFSSVYGQIERALAEDRPIEAVDMLVDWLDDRLCSAQFSAVGRAFAKLKTNELPPDILLATLMVTRPAKEELRPYYEQFCSAVQAELEESGEMTREQARATVSRFE